MNKLQILTRQNIWNVIDDYFRHTYSTDVRDDISDTFVNRLADDAINELAPYAYAPRKKSSRIFKALCDSLDVTDNFAGS